MRSIALSRGATAGFIRTILAREAEILRRVQSPPMANPEHLKTLLSPEWNDWRSRNPSVTTDLTTADLSGKDLTGKDLRRADLSRANLAGAILAGADLTRATLSMARLEGASAPGAIFEQCDMDFLDMTGI